MLISAILMTYWVETLYSWPYNTRILQHCPFKTNLQKNFNIFKYLPPSTRQMFNLTICNVLWAILRPLENFEFQWCLSQGQGDYLENRVHCLSVNLSCILKGLCDVHMTFTFRYLPTWRNEKSNELQVCCIIETAYKKEEEKVTTKEKKNELW